MVRSHSPNDYASLRFINKQPSGLVNNWKFWKDKAIMIDEGIVGIKLKKTFFIFMILCQKYVQVIVYNQIDRIVCESLHLC